MLCLNGQAHAQQPVIKGYFIHCGVQSFSKKESSLLISAPLIILRALFQNTAGAVFRLLNQRYSLSGKGEIRRCNSSQDRRSFVEKYI